MHTPVPPFAAPQIQQRYFRQPTCSSLPSDARWSAKEGLELLGASRRPALSPEGLLKRHPKKECFQPLLTGAFSTGDQPTEGQPVPLFETRLTGERFLRTPSAPHRQAKFAAHRGAAVGSRESRKRASASKEAQKRAKRVCASVRPEGTNNGIISYSTLGNFTYLFSYVPKYIAVSAHTVVSACRHTAVSARPAPHPHDSSVRTRDVFRGERHSFQGRQTSKLSPVRVILKPSALVSPNSSCRGDRWTCCRCGSAIGQIRSRPSPGDIVSQKAVLFSSRIIGMLPVRWRSRASCQK